MKTLNELRAAAHQVQADERETISSINLPEDCLCCLHTHYPQHVISIWEHYARQGPRPEPVDLAVDKDGLVTVKNCGDYPDRAEEFAAILQAWLEINHHSPTTSPTP